jgi:DNA helicase II / ATP-dependent DNA helicase PcrA
MISLVRANKIGLEWLRHPILQRSIPSSAGRLSVAMTRAKDQLALMVPQRFYVHQQARKGDRHLYASRTRFIPGDVARLFEVKSWPVVVRAHDSVTSLPAIDLKDRMRGMWRRTGS